LPSWGGRAALAEGGRMGGFSFTGRKKEGGEKEE